jgi:hypothetical protein
LVVDYFYFHSDNLSFEVNDETPNSSNEMLQEAVANVPTVIRILIGSTLLILLSSKRSWCFAAVVVDDDAIDPSLDSELRDEAWVFL